MLVHVRHASCLATIAWVVASALAPAAALADVELRWEAFESAHAVQIERGTDERSFELLTRVAGAATAYRDEAPPEAPRLCYRVSALDARDRSVEQLVHCLTRPPSVGAPPPSTPEPVTAEPGPARWRGLEGWYQRLPAPPGGDAAAHEADGAEGATAP
ncbi:MAG: hypothetical protein QNK05_03825 [Myxococcota bacterium]|nr:hypothetical protein [Myxococcota bacterium]